MQPAMTGADLLAQLMNALPHSTPAAIPFLPPFSPTQHQHQPTGHTVPQPMQPPFANSTFAQPPSFHTVNTPHYTAAMPGLQPLPQSFTLQHSHTRLSGITTTASFILYVPTHITSNQHNTGTAPAQPLPTTPASQQYQQQHPHVDHNTIFTVDLQQADTTLRMFRGRPRQAAMAHRQIRFGLETFTTFANFHCKHPCSHT